MSGPVDTAVNGTRLECMQVWGGNQATDVSLVTTGLDVYLYADPYGDAEQGGDVYYVSSCSSGRITRLALADVSGHGASVRVVADGLRRLMQSNINRIGQTALVEALNREFAGVGDATTYATALVATYFLPTRTLTVTNAGHPPPLGYSSATRRWSRLGEAAPSRARTNLPLGMFRRMPYTSSQATLESGDRVLWMTDSLIEAEDGRGDGLGVDGVLGLLASVDAARPDRIVPTLLARVRALDAANLREDDTTAVLLTPNAEGVGLRDNLLAPFRYLAGAVRSVT